MVQDPEFIIIFLIKLILFLSEADGASKCVSKLSVCRVHVVWESNNLSAAAIIGTGKRANVNKSVNVFGWCHVDVEAQLSELWLSIKSWNKFCFGGNVSQCEIQWAVTVT